MYYSAFSSKLPSDFLGISSDRKQICTTAHLAASYLPSDFLGILSENDDRSDCEGCRWTRKPPLLSDRAPFPQKSLKVSSLLNMLYMAHRDRWVMRLTSQMCRYLTDLSWCDRSVMICHMKPLTSQMCRYLKITTRLCNYLQTTTHLCRNLRITTHLTCEGCHQTRKSPLLSARAPFPQKFWQLACC